MKILGLFVSLVISVSCFAFSQSEEIESLKTSEPSLLNSYLELMSQKKLIDQASSKLKHRQLLKKDGGLCAFTASVDAIQAISQYYHLYKNKFIKRPDFYLYEVIDEARGYMEDDPTHAGINFEDLIQYTRDVLDRYNLSEYMRLHLVSDLKEINPEKWQQEYWKLRLIGMMSEDKEEGHTIVALRIDHERKIIYTSDPNWPNKVLEIPYKFDHGRLRLFLDAKQFPGFHPATVDQIIEVTIPKF